MGTGSQHPPLQTRLPCTSSGTHGQQPHGSTHPVEHIGGAAQPAAAQSIAPAAPAAPPVTGVAPPLPPPAPPSQPARPPPAAPPFPGVAPPLPPPAPPAPEAPPPPSGLAGGGSLVAPPQAAKRSSQPTIPNADKARVMCLGAQDATYRIS